MLCGCRHTHLQIPIFLPSPPLISCLLVYPWTLLELDTNCPIVFPGRPGTESARPETGRGSETGGTAWMAVQTPAGRMTGTTSEGATLSATPHHLLLSLSHISFHPPYPRLIRTCCYTDSLSCMNVPFIHLTQPDPLCFDSCPSRLSVFIHS